MKSIFVIETELSLELFENCDKIYAISCSSLVYSIVQTLYLELGIEPHFILKDYRIIINNKGKGEI